MRSIVAIFIFGYCCIATAANGIEIAPKSAYKQVGAIVYSPNEADWSLVQANEFGIAFGKQYGAVGETAIANTIVFKVDGFENDKDFLDFIASQREKQDNKKRFKVLSAHNEQLTFKGASCFKYRFLSEDHKNNGIDSPDFQYLKTMGYVCRHPSNKAIAFQMEISHRATEKSFPDSLLAVGEEFFNSVQFGDAGLK